MDPVATLRDAFSLSEETAKDKVKEIGYAFFMATAGDCTKPADTQEARDEKAKTIFNYHAPNGYEHDDLCEKVSELTDFLVACRRYAVSTWKRAVSA